MCLRLPWRLVFGKLADLFKAQFPHSKYTGKNNVYLLGSMCVCVSVYTGSIMLYADHSNLSKRATVINS
jgi:hypothetical protein